MAGIHTRFGDEVSGFGVGQHLVVGQHAVRTDTVFACTACFQRTQAAQLTFQKHRKRAPFLRYGGDIDVVFISGGSFAVCA